MGHAPLSKMLHENLENPKSTFRNVYHVQTVISYGIIGVPSKERVYYNRPPAKVIKSFKSAFKVLPCWEDFKDAFKNENIFSSNFN